jgi:neurotransmitter:Na+ symporter, NSS family
LSLGFGVIHTYASYIREDGDVALTGLSTVSLNEFAEVILGGTIAIPAAVAFFGLTQTETIARGGAFDLGFQALPLVFQQLPWGHSFGALWFVLLFFAGLTSAVALTQPVIAFFEDEFGWSHRGATLTTYCALFVLAQPVIFFFGHGFLDEIDFWVGSFALVVFALVETVLFAWVFGMDRGWSEIGRGGEITIPRIFYYVIKYVTPSILLVILLFWAFQEIPNRLFMVGVKSEDLSFRWGARLLVIGLLMGFALLIRTGKSQTAMETKT